MNLAQPLVLAALLASGAAQALTLPPAPVARNDSYELNSLTLQISAPGLLANDSGTNVFASGYFDPSSGTLDSVVTNGSFQYTPEWGFAGVATFDYIITDAFNRTSQATVSIDASRSVPVARDDFYTASAATLSITAPGLLANDSGGIGSVIVTGFFNPSDGTLDSVVTNGSFVYTAPWGFAGVASFVYLTRDELGRTGTATAFLDYAASIPVAFDDSFSVQSGGLLDIAAPGLLSNDFGGIGSVMVSGYFNPAFGVLEFVVTNGSFRYQAPVGFTGIDSFTYISVDEFGRSSSATVSINVTAVPEPGAWLLLAAGLPFMAAVARRRGARG